MMKADYIFKIVVGGAGGVGKTTLLHRYLHNEFLHNTAMTIGIAFHKKELIRNGQNIILSIWDLGGQDRFRFLQPTYVKGAHAGIVFFDMTFPATMAQVKEWVDLFQNQTSKSLPIILGGTKLDIVDQCSSERLQLEATETVKKLGLIRYLPTSSKSNTNVEEIINSLVDILIAQAAQSKDFVAMPTAV